MLVSPRLLASSLFLASVASAPLAAQQPGTHQLAPVTVQAETPSPAIWEFRKGNKVLWILGALYPVPRDIHYDTRAIEQRIAQSEVVISFPGMALGEDIGFFKGLTLIPAAMKARNNPDGKLLRDVLPADTYARWQAAKAKYIGRDTGIEKRRPLYAAFTLWDAALKKSGLAPTAPWIVTKTAKRHDIPVRDARVHISVDEPRQALKQFRKTPLGDTACMEQTLDRLETDLASMRPRAQAWATGDTERMRALPYREQMDTCLAALSANSVVRAQGVDDLQGQMLARWMAEVRKASAEYDVMFAALPVRQLLDGDGVVESLRREGFELQVH